MRTKRARPTTIGLGDWAVTTAKSQPPGASDDRITLLEALREFVASLLWRAP